MSEAVYFHRMLRVQARAPAQALYGGPEYSFIIRQHEHVLHIQKVLANAGITLAMFSLAQPDRSMNLTEII